MEFEGIKIIKILILLFILIMIPYMISILFLRSRKRYTYCEKNEKEYKTFIKNNYKCRCKRINYNDIS